MSATALDYEAIKVRQRQVWASGNYASIASLIVPIAELLCETAGLRAGDRVLDVACGSGNALIAAARRGCAVTGVDYVPELLTIARTRARAEALDVALVEGDAEALPFADASFDRVLSVVGVMFAPDQVRAAAELLRVCRPGGTVALASWTPEGFIGDLFRLVGKFAPPPAGVQPPALWGSEEHVRRLLAGAADARAERSTFTFRFGTAEEFTDFFITHYGPTLKAAESLDPVARERFREEFIELVRSHDDDVEGSVAVAAEYLTVIATR
jgi:ubiquinone/menaquinone biosynthesis C-methylase UbiE